MLAYDNEFVIICQNVGDQQEYLTHQLLRIQQQVQMQLTMLHRIDETQDVENSKFTDRRETFMQTMSQYLNGVETKFGWFLFEAIINVAGDDHLQDSYLVFRK